METYKCIKSFCVCSYDEDGFPDDNEIDVRLGSKWYLETEQYRTIGGEVRLIKNKKTGSAMWLELSKERLKEYFIRIQ